MTGRPLWSHEVELEAEAVSVTGARQFVRRHLDSHGLRSIVDDVELVVSELATNALMHAGTPFRVSLTRFGQVLLVEITDHSPVAPRPRRAGVFDTAGRGVSIVDVLAADWGVRSVPGNGKTVWVSFPAR